MQEINKMPYRSCVGITLFNAEGLVFIGRRRSEKNIENQEIRYEWQMPQGGIDPGEPPYAAALRELYEETNVRSIKFLGEAKNWYSYDLPFDALGKTFRGRYRGQKQKWFALLFTGKESEMNVRFPGGGFHQPEFVEWRWEKLENLPELIIPFKREVYNNVVREFSSFINIAQQNNEP